MGRCALMEFIAFVEAERYLLQLADNTEFDFYGLAQLDRHTRRLRWIWSYGSTSGRTMHIYHRASGGLTGAALRARRLIVLDAANTKTEHLRSEEPIMLSEALHTAAAAWIGTRYDEEGVLLVGRRNATPFSEEELRSIQSCAVKLSGAIQTIICQA